MNCLCYRVLPSLTELIVRKLSPFQLEKLNSCLRVASYESERSGECAACRLCSQQAPTL